VFEWAWEGDPVSRYGGILAFNFVPSPATTELLQKKFVEILVLPKTPESESWATFFQKNNARIKIILIEANRFGERPTAPEKHSGFLGKLVQDPDFVDVSGCSSSKEKLEKAFGTWASANCKSNAIVLSGFDEKNSVAYMAGCGQGQPNRVDALKLLAIPRAKDFCERRNVMFEKLITFSDAFLPFDDCVVAMGDVGLKKLYQPGGSKRDPEVAETAKKLGIEMVVTGKRHFWH
jgi:phosphoribosylaminoimidazolecarboxamide formyltransferase/IMP cyclohydrolase